MRSFYASVSSLASGRRRGSLAPAVAVLCGIALTVLLCNFVGVTSGMTRFLTEFRFELLQREPTGKIVIVDIDAQSLSDAGIWPWPRRLYGDLIDRLVEGGAEQIAFDIDFSAVSTAEDDAAFASAMERANGIVSLAMFSQKSGHTDANSGDMMVNRPIDRFLDVSWPVVVSVPIEADSRVWRSYFGEVIDGVSELSLSALLGDASGPSADMFWIDYSIDPSRLTKVSFTDVLKGSFPEGTFQGKKVVVGASAQELRDIFPVPVYGMLPGSVIQAIAGESILQNRALSRTNGDLLLALALVLAFPLILAIDTNWKKRLAALAAISVGLELVGLMIQSRYPFILQTGPAQLALLLAGLHLVLKQIGFHQFLLRIARAQTQNSRRMLGQVFDDSFDAIVVINSERKIVAASRTAMGMFPAGLKPGVKASDYLPAEMVAAAASVLDESAPAAAKPKMKTVKLNDRSGEQKIIEFIATGSSHLDISDEGVKEHSAVSLASLTCRDVTEERLANEKLAYLAKVEPLTGLLNRNSFVGGIAQHLLPMNLQQKPCILAIFSVRDLDRITASLGFSYTDKLRKKIARQLTGFLEANDLAASIGDDSFACLAWIDDTSAAPGDFALRLRDAIATEYDIGGNRIPVTVNVGYTIAYGEIKDPDTLLRQARNALSRAQTGLAREIVGFDKTMEEGVNRRQKLEVELARALERDEMRLLYQPQVDIATGEVIGVEALIRWKHRELGMISPLEFISIAEESGRIIELGAWVLEQAMRDACMWRRPLRLAVNVSAVQLTRSDLPGAVKAALDKTGFAANRLDLEVTESLFIDESTDLKKTISKLRKLGCSLAMDDFGTGYSGLGYILRFPFAKIKIDRSFVANMEKDPANIAIVKAVVDMAEAFGMTVVAEGIETIEHRKMLLDLGCTVGQGYYYSRPVPASEIENLLKMAA
ncbi:EAL domain-containing protein [Roseibium sp.]|uniref:EAL domain-containing protein n=1 Tax=Roseibium sp. TaxID=1936156 RepID=UPI003A986B21